MIYPKDFENKIGFDFVREILINKCHSRLGKEMVNNMAFSSDYKEVCHRLQSVCEMRRIKESNVEFPSISTHDVLPYLSEIKALHSFISADKLFKLSQTLRNFNEIINFFHNSDTDDENNSITFPHLSQEIEGLNSFGALEREILSAINKFGEIKDNASSELYEIRRSIREASGSIQRAMRKVLDSAISQGIVEKDATPSIRDGRMVIPVTAGLKRNIAGIVHDESATGKTVYIEPAQVVEAGNKLRELHLQEKREETAILIHLSDCVRPYIEDIANGCLVLAMLDFIDAKAQYAIEINANMPHIADKIQLEWYHALHPGLLLSLRAQNREAVALDLHLSNEHRILIISGPNAGGKSVCLKTVAIVQYMTQCGVLPSLYENSHVGIFKNLFIDIGDQQSIENDLSTYSSHLRNMRIFLQNANKHTLLLADEMGSGTEPRIGGALAQAILQNLSTTGCFGVVTTHYHNLKTFAEETPGFVNGAMLYDRARLQPTYQLSVGNPGSSFAIDIAHKMGLPSDVIENAKKIAGDEYSSMDKYLSDIARDKKYWANKRQNIKEKESKLDNLLSKYEEVSGDLKAQRKEIIDDARREAKEILKSANAQIERTILEIRKAQAEKEKTKELRKNLQDYITSSQESVQDNHLPEPLKELRHKSRKNSKEKHNSSKPVNVKPLEAGDYVKLDDGASIGQILSINGKKAEVSFGSLRTIVEVKRLKGAQAPKKPTLNTTSTLSSATTESSRERQLNFRNEIDIRGMRADEAIQAVTYFLDDAIQFNAQRVRILHGTGHGILKTLIRQQLKANTAVTRFADEDIRFGGAGITVVDLE